MRPQRLGRWTLAALGPALLAATPASSTPHAYTEFAIFATQSVDLNGRHVDAGLVGSNADLTAGNTTLPGVRVGGSVDLNGTVRDVSGDIVAGGAVDLGVGHTIFGDVHSSALPSFFPSADEVKTGTRLEGSVFARGDVLVPANKLLTGNLFTDGDAKVGLDATVQGNLGANGDVALQQNSDVLGSVTHAGVYSTQSGVTIGSGPFQGTTTVNVTLFEPVTLPPATLFTAGTGLQPTAGTGITDPLAPGAYGTLTAQQIHLTSGTYAFAGIDTPQGTVLRLDLSSGNPLVILVSGDVTLHGNDPLDVFVSADGLTYQPMANVDKNLAGTVRLESLGSVRAARNAEWFGSIYTPNEGVWGERFRVIGSVYAGGYLDGDPTNPGIHLPLGEPTYHTYVPPQVAGGAAPTLTITAPAADALLGASPVAVTGTLTGTAPITAVVNGAAATLSPGAFSASVPLVEGPNTLTATATNAFGTASVNVAVTLDTMPPTVAITSPANGAIISTATVAVSGTATDANGVTSVQVNGIADSLTGQTWTATVPVSAGQNSIVATATDTAGHSNSDSISVTGVLDSDGDGISDDYETQVGTDPNDSSSRPLDFDRDGVPNQLDLDDDGDGVPDDVDTLCTETSPGLAVDAQGCPLEEQQDADGDGIPDVVDLCSNTPGGESLGPNGCSLSQLDADQDGILDPSDPDMDGDGVPNDTDWYPRDAGDWADSDQDGLGDNRDPDRDGDRVPNDVETQFGTDPSDPSDTPPDLDRDGVPDGLDTDTDGDGVENAADPFPIDPAESADSDGDGIGDNADEDRDGDGFANDRESATGADPGDPDSRPADLDGDFLPDVLDPDRDGDGASNNSDVFPNDPLESRDSDADGVGDNGDPDRDGDGVENGVDAFPDDPFESSDLDQDGIGDHVDQDRDGDGILNYRDAFPDDASAGSDLDGDGLADALDPDLDGDGVDNTADLFPQDAAESADLDGDGIGDHGDPDRDGDGVANDSDPYPNDPTRSSLPSVTITSPATLTTHGSSPLQVTGTVDPTAVSLTVNGSPVSINGGTYSAQVALQEGHNTIVARMVDAAGTTSTASISVSLDTTPPYITIESHQDGEIVRGSPILVSGLINDIVRGTIEANQTVVTVNGYGASVANRSYSVDGVALTPGANPITVIATDQVGNVAQRVLTLQFAPPSGRKLERVSGQGQSATIGELVPEPLVVRVLDAAGNPVSGEQVAFRVIQGAGLVGDGTGLEARAQLVATNAQGLAQTRFRLGQRSGTGNHKVRAQVVGYDDEIVFSATALGMPADKLTVNAGNNQRGGLHQPLPGAFVVAAIDEGWNVVRNARVEFRVLSGGGQFQNGLQVFETTTDSDGRASAHLTLGGVPGLDAQRVKATLLDKAPSVETADVNAIFTASGFELGDPGQTSITGLVVDNQHNPVPGVIVRVDGTTREAVVDAQGQFTITQVPVGNVHLIADGSTATVEGEYPSLSQDLVTIAGTENPLAAPIYMVKLNTENAVYAGLEDVAITLPDVPGFKLEVPAGSVTFPDGSREGYLSVTSVNSSAVPMAPPNGMQPQFIVTIQPTGAMFDPPARMTLPNVDGHAPGQQVEMFSYDHDLEEFVAIGLGTVSEDGTVIASNPGVGVVKAGWHCGAQPGVTTCCSGPGECKHPCTDFSGVCLAGCRLVPERPRPDSEQTEGDCETLLCGGDSLPDPNDKPKETPPPNLADCQQPSCDPEGWEPASETSGVKAQNLCEKCEDGERVADDEAVPPESEQTPEDCKKLICEGGTKTTVDDPADKPLDTNPRDCQEPTCPPGIFAFKDETAALPDPVCQWCDPALPGVPRRRPDGTSTPNPCQICLGGRATNFLEPQGPSFVCAGDTYRYRVSNRHPSPEPPTYSGDVDSTGRLSVPADASDGDPFTITVEANGCSITRTVTASDGRPGIIPESLACLLNPSACSAAAPPPGGAAKAEADAWSEANEAALGGGLQGGCGDAARHSYFNALVRLLSGSEAQTHGLSDAHEFSGLVSCDDNNMDLTNNEVGREIGAGCTDRACIVDGVLDALESGDLTVFSGNCTPGIPGCPSGTLVSSRMCRVNRGAITPP